MRAQRMRQAKEADSPQRQVPSGAMEDRSVAALAQRCRNMLISSATAPRTKDGSAPIERQVQTGIPSSSYVQSSQNASVFQLGKSKRQRELAKAEKKSQSEQEKQDRRERDDSTYRLARAGSPKEVDIIESEQISEAKAEFKIKERKDHILNRHLHANQLGVGKKVFPGKTVFPSTWGPDVVLNAITQVCMNSKSYSENAKYGKSIRGWHRGVLIEVYFFKPEDGREDFEVSTAYPLKGTGVTTNAGEDNESE